MTPRERYLETVLFGKPDKVPFSPGGPRESTLARWHQEGLPKNKNYMTAIYEILGIKPDPPSKVPVYGINVSFRMIPTFEEKVLEHKDGHYIVQDWMGAITEISDKYDYTYIRAAKDFVTRKWHRFPVQNHADWEEMKKRYNPREPGRHDPNLVEHCKAMKDRDYVVGFGFNGPFWQIREWVGMENLCMLMLDDPEFVMEMAEFWTEFVSKTMEPILENVAVDYVSISEDMAYKAHSMISPSMARKFLLPAYKRWSSEIRSSGCQIIYMDSDGYVGELIPIWIEGGINYSGPNEVAAENDIVEFRRMFGKSMAFNGGIDKRAIAKGGKVIRDELERVIPPLFKDGGFIPGCDHGVPHDISWQNFIEYSKLLAEMTGWL
ncbi:MAG: uroporphyrinogen decarboxylase family protein [bacterium]